MSLDVLREGALTSRKHDLTAAASSQSASLRALHAVTALLNKNSRISGLFNCQPDLSNIATLDPEEEKWLQSNSLQNGCHFDETSLPTPILQHDGTSTHVVGLNRHTGETVDQAFATENPGALTTEASLTAPSRSPTSTDPMATSAVNSQMPIVSNAGHQPSVIRDASAPAKSLSGPGPAPLSKIAPPEPEEEANFTAATDELLNLESPQRPAKTVHLPPKEVQEERLREAEEERRRKPSAHGEKPPRRLSHLQTQTDVASSPSSTVGAYSAATPMPAQDSPDTSPDSEHAQVEVPQEFRPTPEERRAKEEHDQRLEAQKEIARKQALGDVATPDDQLRWEEREAAARNAEENAARKAAQETSSDAQRLTAVGDNAETVTSTDLPAASDDAMEKPSEINNLSSNTAPEASTNGNESEGDNITVTPRVGTFTSQQPPPARVNVDTSSPDENAVSTLPGTPTHRNISEMASATPIVTITPSKNPHRRTSSLGAVSPKTLRNPQYGPAGAPNMVAQTPKQLLRLPLHQHTPTNNFAAIAQLTSLKGASDDPDRDYLEPLFRIQAHDSPNIKTQALPELLRSSTKTLSTEDHFNALHERMDFRMLRRIYQLQNANKWSLRQMEKCREPPQPETHHDRIMGEMKWMCKDFREERKMKKSICARLARRCADWVAADATERKHLQVKVKIPPAKTAPSNSEDMPELESSGESAPEDEEVPGTPHVEAVAPSRLVVDPELLDHVEQLQDKGSLRKAMDQMPLWKPAKVDKPRPMTRVSKFVQSKVLPKQDHPFRKRSRYDYEDEDKLGDDERNSKRVRSESNLPAEDQDIALFHPDNKSIRDRLHANNAFRPPSEFQMPGTPFYEFRNGSQWVWEDDQKLRKLAKDYSFNWSLIAEEMNLPSRFKSGMERRTPWECFERWVELEQLPAEMRKTVYFKTWYQRLDQSQQAVDRRYSAQLAAAQQLQQNSSNGQQQHMPMKRRTLPIRVEKRKTTRYIWMVDAMRKHARKRETATFKQAEAQRAAAQRKASTQQNETNQARGPMMTPQEWSRKRYERDVQMAEMQRQHRQKMIEASQRQAQIARAQHQGLANGTASQQRPATAQQPQTQPASQQHPAMNAQMMGQRGQAVPVPTRNGHLAVPQINGQGIPQAHMRPAQGMAQPADMQRMAQANQQARPQQYAGQQYQMPSSSMTSPGPAPMNTQQQLASNQALLQAFQQHGQQGQHQPQGNGGHNQAAQAHSNQQAINSPSMPPPPTPGSASQQLSSGHVPAVVQIKNQIRSRYPNMHEAEITKFATEQLQHQSQSNAQSQVRQNAMNAAAGISNVVPTAPANNVQSQYNHNQTAYQSNGNLPNGPNGGYVNGESNAQGQQNGANGAATSPQQNYAQLMRQRQMQQMRMQSPNQPHAQLAGSPGVTHASPQMNPASPSMQYNVPNMPMNNGMPNQPRPPSRSNTPHMQRLGSSGGVPTTNGMQSPGAVGPIQGSPRNMQASMAR